MFLAAVWQRFVFGLAAWALQPCYRFLVGDASRVLGLATVQRPGSAVWTGRCFFVGDAGPYSVRWRRGKGPVFGPAARYPSASPFAFLDRPRQFSCRPRQSVSAPPGSSVSPWFCVGDAAPFCVVHRPVRWLWPRRCVWIGHAVFLFGPAIVSSCRPVHRPRAPPLPRLFLLDPLMVFIGADGFASFCFGV